MTSSKQKSTATKAKKTATETLVNFKKADSKNVSGGFCYA